MLLDPLALIVPESRAFFEPEIACTAAAVENMILVTHCDCDRKCWMWGFGVGEELSASL